ncbi:PAS domain S-box protein [Piscinibacter sakaiensis]|uniref:histidine kinase n=1 Tax=Piscinibacter sakaiensis TaxID=1547922 RepID=A0A0K8P360_PISS1|nr:PAS domain S-box protein [Piscinibacter sakaiensis]GAP36615.1 hypothetical protein ISF6_2455 [Piscinibacter sakaiensis]
MNGALPWLPLLAIGVPALVLAALVLAVLRDSARRRAAAAELELVRLRLVHQEDQRRRAEAIAQGQVQVLRLIATGAPLREVLSELMRYLEDLSPGMMASVLLLDEDGRHLRHGAAPSLPAAFVAAVDGVEIGPAVGSCGTCAWRREPVVVEDIETDPLWADYRHLAEPHGLRACWSAPIFDAGRRVLGTFAMYHRSPARPTEHHLRLTDIATQSAAIAISHAAAQAALQRQMALLQSTLEHMDQGVVILDPALRVVAVNRRTPVLIGSTHGVPPPGTPFADLVRRDAALGRYGPGEVEALVAERIGPVQRREAHRQVREPGDGRVIDVRGSPLPDGGFVLTYTDIGSHQRAEREALRFRAALDLSNDAIYLVDAVTLEVLDCNAGACRALGYTREELIGHGVEQLFADRSRDELAAEYAALVAGRDGRVTFEAEHRHKDGHLIPVEINRRIHHTPQGPLLVGVARDIREHRRAADELRASEEMLRVIVEDALDAAVRIDAEGCVIGWNAQAERTFGWSAAEAAGRSLSALIVPERHRDAHERGRRHFLATGHGPALNRRLEMSALRRDGQEIPVELTVTPVRTGQGWVFSAFLRDLSAVHASEAQRATLEAQLRESQKMEAIGTLAGGIAHDFNNILAAILANAALARDALGGGGAAAGELTQIERSAQRARSLVQQILAFGRRHEPQLEALDLRPLIEEVHALMRALLPAGVALERVEPAWPVRVLGDATQLQQVLMNLCTNAWHALGGEGGPGGRIELGVAVEPGAAGPPSRARLWVRDNGCGMDEATRQRIFEPFFTTKPVGQGTGLGLSVVHGIVRSHGGELRVDSAPGAGSCFEVLLPLAPADAAAPPPAQGALPPVPDAVPAAPQPAAPGAQATGAAPQPDGGGRRVMVIDDDETMAVVVERLLERAGYRVATWGEAAPALQACRADPAAWDLVVTDYNMPDLSGFDVARELARLRPELPVIVSSGYVTDAMQQEARQLGVRALLHKENTLEELAALVQRVLAPAGAPATPGP